MWDAEKHREEIERMEWEKADKETRDAKAAVMRGTMAIKREKKIQEEKQWWEEELL